MKSKYNAKKIIVDGITFSSKLEAGRYQFLKAIEAKGVITDLELQPRFILQTKFKLGKESIREIAYVADFRYTVCATGQDTVEDTKGFKTAEYKIKAKMFKFHYVLNANLVFYEIKTAGDITPLS